MNLKKTAFWLVAAMVCWLSPSIPAVAAQVAGQAKITAPNGGTRTTHDAGVVFWLKPSENPSSPVRTGILTAPRPRLVQRKKAFDPHVLAVQVGSEVDFPNHDPFFHNVFSLFNGKRFDLGLYEAGATRAVRFDRSGICYIFCNIHPQMSAAIVVVDTPYFAVSDDHGQFTIPQVPPGRYQLDVWEEHCTPQTLKAASREVTVGEGLAALGTIQLQQSNEPVTSHLNKYGNRYDPDVFPSPLYIKP